MSTEQSEELAQIERERRLFVRTQHPDRGGDAPLFTAGLADYERRRQQVMYPPHVTGVRTPRGARRVLIPALQLFARRRRPPRVR